MRLLFLFCLTGLLYTASAQTVNDTSTTPYWIDMMADPSVNFYQTQRAFDLYWQNRQIEKGSGYKPFKRWEYNMRQIVDSVGKIPQPGQLEAEVQKYLKLRKLQSSTTSGALGGSAATCLTTGNWEELGPQNLPTNRTGQPNGLGRLNAIAFHPTDTNIIYVGAPAGGLWMTKNGGQTWSTNTDTLASLGISSIAVDPYHPDTIYLGTGDRDASDSYGVGVFKSTDGGQTWVSSNTGMGDKTVGKLVIDPNNTNILLAATNGGIYRSTNGGSSWSLELSGNYKDLVFDAVNSQILFACGSSATLYKSTNNGQTWTQITSGLPSSKYRMAVAVTPSDSNMVYVVVTNSRTFEGLYLSTDRGSSFTQMSDTPNIMDYSHLGTGTGGQAWYDLDIAVDPTNNAVVYVCGVNIFQSLDSGKTWKINAHWVGNGGAPEVHADNHVMEYQPSTNTLFTGNDGGIYYTKNRGTTWTDISDGIAIAQIYKLGQSATESNTIINGYQDNGTGYYEKGKWYTVIGGDGMDCVIDPTTSQWAYSELYYGDIRRIKDGYSQGTIAKNGVNSISESGGWVTPYVLREGTPSTMYIGYKNIWRSTNIQATSTSSVSWTKISNNVAGSNAYNITAIENSIANSDILYVSRSDNKFFKSNNVNSTSPSWTDLTSNLPNSASVLNIETHPRFSDRVWICQSNKIYQSNNGGNSWTNISSGLPNIPVLCLVFDTSSQLDGMYAGTYMGVFYKDTTMSSWKWFNDNMPINTRVRDIEIFYSPSGRGQSHVVCGTYGRGNWKSGLYDEVQKKPIAGFQAGNRVLCAGQTVSFTDTSDYTPTAWLWRVSPNTVQFVNGTDSSSRNPIIQFDSAGTYSIQFFAENCNGLDSVTKTNLVKVPEKVVAAKCTTQTTNTSVNYGIGIFQIDIDEYSFTSQGVYDEGAYLERVCDEIIKLEKDSSYLVKVKTGLYNDEYVRIYIDFNANGDFSDSGELVFNTKTRTNHQDTITIPSSVTLDTMLRMRVMSDFSSISNSCSTLNYGQTEDYSIFIENMATRASVYDTSCNNYTWSLNSTTYTSSGTYSHTLVGQNAYGGDSIVTLHLLINEESQYVLRDTACSSYTWKYNSTTYTKTGVYSDTLVGANSVGCDSIVTLNLVVNDASTAIDTQIACDRYTWIDNNTYTSSNDTATYTLTNSVGCDSVVTLNLTVVKSTSSTDVQTACGTYTWIDGVTYTASNNTAKDTLTNSSGCDSVITLNLTINNPTSSSLSDTACDSYTWVQNSVTYTSSGTYMDTLSGANSVGCDSIVTLNLIINESTNSIDSVVACDSYKWVDGNTYTANNSTATFKTVNSLGCDSIVTLNLVLNTSSSGIDTVEACDRYKWIDGNTYTSDNNSATFLTKNRYSCDSVVTLNLDIKQTSFATVLDTACDSYTWSFNGETYSNSGTFKDTLLGGNSEGCDSVLTLQLIVYSTTYGTDSVTACDSYKWMDGKTYTSSNTTAKHVLVNKSMCDSIVSLNLTVNLSNTGIFTTQACDSFTWIDGVTYTSNNTSATYTLTNQFGCDSVIQLDLEVFKSKKTIDTHEECGSFTWIDGNTYTSDNTKATVALKTQRGCDSIVTLNLKILEPTTGTDKIQVCDSFTWLDGLTYKASNSSAKTTLVNADGCDSLVSLDLVVNYSEESTAKHIACDSFEWVDGFTYHASNDSASIFLVNEFGCDSIVYLDLTINNSSTSKDSVVACKSYEWINGKTYTSDNKDASITLANTKGCDSTVSLDLRVINFINSITVTDPTLTSEDTGVAYQWMRCKDGDFDKIVGATSQTYNAKVNGEYAVEVSLENCLDTSECVNILSASILNQHDLESVVIYPNPTEGRVWVRVLNIGEYSVRFISLDGQLLKNVDQINRAEINLDIDLPQGIYIVEIATKNNLLYKKLIVR